MIERHYGQRQIAEGFFKESIEDWWEPWMKKADEIHDDEELIETVYEALRRRHPQSATRGRKGTPAEIVIRLMVLKHVRGWSYERWSGKSEPIWFIGCSRGSAQRTFQTRRPWGNWDRHWAPKSSKTFMGG